MQSDAKTCRQPDQWGDYVHFRCGAPFVGWLDRLCRAECRTRSQTLHLALIRFAESIGFAEPPPPRIGTKQ